MLATNYTVLDGFDPAVCRIVYFQANDLPSSNLPLYTRFKITSGSMQRADGGEIEGGWLH